MNQKTKSLILNVLGIIYVFLGILAFYNAIVYTETANILWFSYSALFLVGLGLLTRKAWLIASQLCIVFIPYIIWNMDFFYVLFSGHSLWGITDYFFTPRKSSAQLISLQHIFTVPVSLLGIYFIKLKTKGFWKFSLAHVAVIAFLTLAFTSPEENINCIFSNCLPFAFSGPLYMIAWLVAYAVMVFSVSLILFNIKSFWKR